MAEILGICEICEMEPLVKVLSRKYFLLYGICMCVCVCVCTCVCVCKAVGTGTASGKT